MFMESPQATHGPLVPLARRGLGEPQLDRDLRLREPRHGNEAHEPRVGSDQAMDLVVQSLRWNATIVAWDLVEVRLG